MQRTQSNVWGLEGTALQPRFARVRDHLAASNGKSGCSLEWKTASTSRNEGANPRSSDLVAAGVGEQEHVAAVEQN